MFTAAVLFVFGSCKQKIRGNRKIIRKQNNVACFRFVHAAFPIVDRLLADADCLCERLLRNAPLCSQVPYPLSDHTIILEEIFSYYLTKKISSCRIIEKTEDETFRMISNTVEFRKAVLETLEREKTAQETT